jgi:hypothetical protein
MPNYTDPVIWNIKSDQFRCFPNADIIPETHPYYNNVAQAAKYYNRAMDFYLQGLVQKSRYGEESDNLNDIYCKMWNNIADGCNELENVREFCRIKSIYQMEKDIVGWTKFNFDQMVLENPRWFALRTPEWYESQKKWEEFRREEEIRAEKRKNTPKISILKPRASVVERFRESGREYEEERQMRKEDHPVGGR